MKYLLWKTRLKAVILIIACLPASGSRAIGEETPWEDHFEASGWVEAYKAFRTESPHDSLSSRAWSRLALSMDFDSFYGFVSADVEKNWEIEAETGIDLHEAWLEHAGNGWDLRIGRQIIIWGKADGIQITDIISPPDYTEYITRDLDEIRQPVDAGRFRILGDRVDTELIWMPVFQPAVFPAGNNPWNIRTPLPANVNIYKEATIEPATSVDNSEIALKMSAFLSGLDIAASAFYTWDDYPVMHRIVTSTGTTMNVHYYPEHHRLSVFGLECSRPWSDFVFRGEVAFYKGRYYEKIKITDNPVQKDALKWLIGADWSPGNDWTVIAQLTGAAIFNYEPELADSRHSPMAILNFSKKLWRQNLTLSNMLYYCLDDGEIFDRVKAKYEVMDNFSVQAGIDMFYGPDDGSIGRYQDNTEVWIKARYSF